MHDPELVHTYQEKTDEELFQLLAEAHSLTLEAYSALVNEVASRGIDARQVTDAKSQSALSHAWRAMPLKLQSVGAFGQDILMVYHNQFWLFLKLMTPAVVVGYIAVTLGRSQANGMMRGIVPGSEVHTHIFLVFVAALVRIGSYLVSWVCSCWSFAAICNVIFRARTGSNSSFSESFFSIRDRTGTFLRVSCLLFVVFGVSMAAASMGSVGIVWALRHYHAHPTHLQFQVISWTCAGLALLMLSRFGLAIPVVVLEDCTMAQSMFRSNELTQGKWLMLTILTGKFLVGGYVAAMSPYWVVAIIPVTLGLPSWFGNILSLASVFNVSLIELFLFIGFTLMYLQSSASSFSHANTSALQPA
jgi:hypothetical protein